VLEVMQGLGLLAQDAAKAVRYSAVSRAKCNQASGTVGVKLVSPAQSVPGSNLRIAFIRDVEASRRAVVELESRRTFLSSGQPPLSEQTLSAPKELVVGIASLHDKIIDFVFFCRYGGGSHEEIQAFFAGSLDEGTNEAVHTRLQSFCDSFLRGRFDIILVNMYYSAMGGVGSAPTVQIDIYLLYIFVLSAGGYFAFPFDLVYARLGSPTGSNPIHLRALYRTLLFPYEALHVGRPLFDSPPPLDESTLPRQQVVGPANGNISSAPQPELKRHQPLPQKYPQTKESSTPPSALHHESLHQESPHPQTPSRSKQQIQPQISVQPEHEQNMLLTHGHKTRCAGTQQSDPQIELYQRLQLQQQQQLRQQQQLQEQRLQRQKQQLHALSQPVVTNGHAGPGELPLALAVIGTTNGGNRPANTTPAVESAHAANRIRAFHVADAAKAVEAAQAFSTGHMLQTSQLRAADGTARVKSGTHHSAKCTPAIEPVTIDRQASFESNSARFAQEQLRRSQTTLDAERALQVCGSTNLVSDELHCCQSRSITDWTLFKYVP
jgi:hypothetical protein